MFAFLCGTVRAYGAKPQAKNKEPMTNLKSAKE